MLIILTSPDAVLRKGMPDPELAKVLIQVREKNNPVALVSNHGEPEWFQKTFGESAVQFLQNRGRQSGQIISTNANAFSLQPYDVIVLAAKDEDVQMGKNGQALLVAAGWSSAPQVSSLGIRVDSAKEFQEVIDLSSGWTGNWWFKGDAGKYSVRALSDLSAYGKSTDQQNFSQRLTKTVKGGGGKLNALLAITARSLLVDGTGAMSDLVWGVYPSSSSANDDDEVLSDFAHRLRTTVSRVRHSKRGEPLFIRHKPSPKRSLGGGGDRTDPTDQLLTLHLNPFYLKSGRLVGKNVIVVDDCTTYGVSFGVAAAFLLKAGASTVKGIALGKFGSQLRYYEIDIQSDPFRPVAAGTFSVKNPITPFPGATSPIAQDVLRKLIP